MGINNTEELSLTVLMLACCTNVWIAFKCGFYKQRAKVEKSEKTLLSELGNLWIYECSWRWLLLTSTHSGTPSWSHRSKTVCLAEWETSDPIRFFIEKQNETEKYLHIYE